MLRTDSGSFDIPWKVSFPISCMIIAFFMVNATPELRNPIDYPDYDFFEKSVDNWEPSDIFEKRTLHVKIGLGKLSVELFNNHKIVPLALSVALLFTVYLLAVQLSKKNIAGVFAVFILGTSYLFRLHDTSAVYDNSWVLFFFLSMYFVKRKWFLSPPMFILALLSKPLPFLFLPCLLYMIYKSGIKRRNDLLAIYGLMTFGLGIMYVTGEGNFVPNMGFVEGFYDWFFYLFGDLHLAFLIPLSMVLLALYARKGVPNAGVLLVCMLNLAFYGVLVEGLTVVIANELYRFIPLVAMFAVSAGVLVMGGIEQAHKKRIALRTGLGKLN